LDSVVALSAAAVILGAVGLVRAYVEFGAPGLVAFGKLALAPLALAVWGFVMGPGIYQGKFPRNALPSNEALKVILGIVLGLTGVAFALSAAFGVGWLVSK
jgi:hypothetical protein